VLLELEELLDELLVDDDEELLLELEEVEAEVDELLLDDELVLDVVELLEELELELLELDDEELELLEPVPPEPVQVGAIKLPS
jgi:hypothetical protein